MLSCHCREKIFNVDNGMMSIGCLKKSLADDLGLVCYNMFKVFICFSDLTCLERQGQENLFMVLATCKTRQNSPCKLELYFIIACIGTPDRDMHMLDCRHASV
jgi:hypothetical protein